MSERRVTVDVEPVYWLGSPATTWLAAIVAWCWVCLLVLLYLVGALR
jgi:hypothetical protein